MQPLARELEKLLCTLPLEGSPCPLSILWLIGADWSSIVGIGEIVLLPLDVLKIKRQTNPEAFRGRGLFKIISDEGMGLYRGAGWTAARNAPGSFAVRSFSSLIMSNGNSDRWIAFRWFCLRQRIYLLSPRLQRRLLGPKLRRLHLRRQRIPHRLCSPRRHQNSNSKPKLWEPRIWYQNYCKYDQERRCRRLFQGPCTQVIDDRSQACV